MDKYPFQVMVHRTSSAFPYTKDFATIGAALAFAKEESRKRFVIRVEVTGRVAVIKQGLDITH